MSQRTQRKQKNPLITAGDRFGCLTVVDPDRRTQPSPSQKIGHQAALCRCDCGVEKVIIWMNLRRGGTISCGCVRARRVAEAGRRTATHGLSSHPLYKTWHQMVERCTKPTAHNYKWYGARGVKVHAPWVNDVSAFVQYCIAELGERPPGYSLDRIDNDGNYEPGNLRWASQSMQVRNSRKCARGEMA